MDRNGIHDAGFLHLDEAANRNAIDTGANRARQATRRLLPMNLGSNSRCSLTDSHAGNCRQLTGRETHQTDTLDFRPGKSQ